MSLRTEAVHLDYHVPFLSRPPGLSSVPVHSLHDVSDISLQTFFHEPDVKVERFNR